MKILAYECTWNLDHIPKRPKRGDVERKDAFIYPEHDVERWKLIKAEPYNGHKPLNFLGWPKRLSKTDFPYNSPGFPLMSKRMLEVLRSVGEFPHKLIPTRIFFYDLEYEIEEYLNQQNLDPELCNENYFAVQLLEHVDVADLERCTYEPSYDGSMKIDKLVLREPPEGFPPLFRVKGDPFYLFASPAAKQALDTAGIKSMDYTAWDENGIAGRVYRKPDGTEQIGHPLTGGVKSY
jgi:hypothetical protein